MPGIPPLAEVFMQGACVASKLLDMRTWANCSILSEY